MSPEVLPAESRAAAQDGVLLVDKPAGLTSAGVVRVLKARLKPKKIGHGGTLDPFATGLLVVLIGKATKLSSLFLDGEKSYSGVIRLGIGTDTEDITGTETASDPDIADRFPEKIWQQTIEKIRQVFLGEIEQTPPVYSALKVQGKRSYDLARQGVAVEHKPRRVQIFELQIAFRNPTELTFYVRCSKGTYIRSLARDIGKFLGTHACLESLRRESSSGFELRETAKLDDISKESLEGQLMSAPLILERLAHKTTASASQA